MQGTNISETFPKAFDQAILLNEAIMPITLVTAIVALIVKGMQGMNGDVRAMTLGLGNVLVVAILIPTFPDIVNKIQLALHHIAQSTGANPSDTANQFANLIIGETGNKDIGFIDILLDRNGGIGKTLTYLLISIVSTIALAVQYVAIFLQQFLMIFGIALSPIFFAMLLLSPTRGIATTYFLRIFAVALWPIGFSLGDLVNSSLLEVAAGADVKSDYLPGFVLQTSQSLFFAAVISIVMLVSAIGGPAIISKAVTTGANAGADFIQRASSAMGLGVAYGVVGTNAAQLAGASPLRSAAAGAASAASGIVSGAAETSGFLVPTMIGLSAAKSTNDHNSQNSTPTDYNAKAAEIANRKK